MSDGCADPASDTDHPDCEPETVPRSGVFNLPRGQGRSALPECLGELHAFSEHQGYVSIHMEVPRRNFRA